MQLAQHARQGFERIQDAGCHRNQNDVVAKGPEKILFDGPHGSATQANGSGHPLEASAGKNNIGSFNGHIGAGADGQPDIGLGQRRGVVDAVTHHSDPFAFFL